MIHFELVTLDGIKFAQNVHEVQMPTTEGYAGFFEHHMPLVTLAETGVIKIRKKATDSEEQQELIATGGGVVEVKENSIRVLVDEASLSTEIDEDKIKKAHAEALELQRRARDQVSLDKAQAMVERAAVRLKVADLKRRTRR